MRRLLALLLLIAAPAAAGASDAAAGYDGPIIDVHLHGYGDGYDPVPMAVTTNMLPQAYRGVMSPPTAEEHRRETLAAMERHNIVFGIVSAGAPTDQRALGRAWREEGGARIAVGFSEETVLEGADPGEVEAALREGEMRSLSELALQYHGVAASDPRFEPYFALAERLDVPVGIHAGAGPPRSANTHSPGFRTTFGDPRLIEEVLIRHPRLRVWLMHGGWPYLAETKAILQQYPEVHLDISAINWVLPRAEFHRHLQALVDAGFGDRLMFGSDQMRWPQAIALAIEGVDSAPFLTAEQKADIFYNNAARFFRIDPAGRGARAAASAGGAE